MLYMRADDGYGMIGVPGCVAEYSLEPLTIANMFFRDVTLTMPSRTIRQKSLCQTQQHFRKNR